MVQVTIHEAKTNLSKLIKKALAGEEVIIARGNEPLVKLSPLAEKRFRRRLGGAKDMIQNISEDFDAPSRTLRIICEYPFRYPHLSLDYSR